MYYFYIIPSNKTLNAMTASAIFTAAHATARTLTAGTYRTRFAAGLKAAYAAAKAPAKASAVETIEGIFGAEFEVKMWKGGEKVRAYVTAPGQSRAYQQVGFIDVTGGKYTLSVHPSRTSRGRDYDNLMKSAVAAL